MNMASNVAEQSSPDEKSPWLGLFLSLVVTGAGQLYNGELVKAGIMFGVAVVSGLAFGIGALLVIVPLQIYSAIDAYRSAERIKAQKQQVKHERLEAEAAAAKFEAETVSAQDLVTQLDKLHRLFTSELLDEGEFSARKKIALDTLLNRRPRENAEDFLAALVPLARSGALSPDELKQIKALVL
jgi:TM2 domain-containing membrane protein YozV